MHDDLHKEVSRRLATDYRFAAKGAWLREGKCPGCGKKELYARAEAPWVLRCGRLDRCGWEGHVKQLYPDIFDDWSKRYQKTEADPNAAADAYLQHARGFDLHGLRGCYTQEYYHDQQLNIGSATVRFPMPGGGYWERLIDQPARFGKKKARFSYGVGYAGQWWKHPALSLEAMARADQLWICEGIFDAIALAAAGKTAVSAMSTNNYPEAALAELRQECARIGVRGPKLIWAFDVGAAGVTFTRKYVERAREDGWTCGAAQVQPDGEGVKLDWNDLAQRDRLTPANIDTYLWNGEVTIAASAAEKALLFYRRDRYASFPLVFQNRQLWAEFSAERINEIAEGYSQRAEFADLDHEEKYDLAAKEAVVVHEIANCAFRALYFQRDEAADESSYYFAIDFPDDRPRIKGTFTGAAISASAEFKKRLLTIAPGGIWTGSQYQIDRLMQRQLARIKSVEAIQFTGYSIDHKAWVLGDIAVRQGRVFEPNEEDYFDFGRVSVKLRTSERMLAIRYDPDKLELRWVPLVLTAFGPKGLVALAFFFTALFAEQIRATQKSLAFLEMTGEPGTGKTTLIEFLWRLLGRDSYEGFDPAKATSAAIARNLGKVGNLPVVLLEGDRTQEVPHSRRFEWDELKTAYNGRSVRARGVANGGMETFEPPFRGAVVIAQNAPVEASTAMRERIMAIHFDKAGFSPETKTAAERIEAVQTEDVSGFIVHAIRREADVMKAYFEAFARHEKLMMADPEVRNGRLVKNHAQLAAMFDAMRLVVTAISDRDAAAAQDFIRQMLRERQLAVNSDHPHVTLFWERFDWIASQMSPDVAMPLDHSRTPAVIAVNLVQFEQKCGDFRLSLPCPMTELKRLLKGSKARKFVGAKTVNSRADKTIHCWCFENPDHAGAR